MKESFESYVESRGKDILCIDEQSTEIMIFGAFMPLILELASESLKSCTPNMKKKKDPSFDELKTNVIKPLKECVGIIKNHFAQCSTAWIEESQSDLLKWEEGEEIKLIAKLDFENKIGGML